MQNSIKDKVLVDVHLKNFQDLVVKIAKVEYKALGLQHLVEFDELVNIGLHTICILGQSKSMDEYNESYLSTAIKWAIRNEMRNRFRWYGVRQKQMFFDSESINFKEAAYKTILSTDEMLDSEHTFEIKDEKKNPEENCEFEMFANAIKEVLATLPVREKELIESKFYKEMKLHEIANEFQISQSRISRIIKNALDKIKDEIIKNEL